MIIANVAVNAVYAQSSNCLLIPKGIAGARVQFSFSSDWDNLEKVIVFRGKSKVLGNLMADESAELPQELTKEIGVRLSVGVYGVNSEKTVAIPTLWADLGIVRHSADPSGAPAADPEFAPWVEIRKDMGSLADLETDEKSSLVKAINEVNSKAGNSGGNVDFRTDETLTLKDGVLSVNTTNDMEQDNTLPITSAGVFATVGNIEALLKTI